MTSKIKSVLEDYKLLLNNVPTLMTLTFVLSTVLMNLAAAKIIFNFGNVALTGGFIISFAPFLAMDTVTHHFGARASIMLNLLSALGNVFTVIFLSIVAAIPTPGHDYTAFNSIHGAVWFIALSSTVAFIVSGIANSLLNALIGKLFRNHTNSSAIFFYRAYVSTFVGQAIDNFLFIGLTYSVFAPRFWGSDPMSLMTCIGTAIVGGAIELLLEVIMGPIGLVIVRRWEKEGVGQQYIQAHSSDRL